jgi:hypothetical protein
MARAELLWPYVEKTLREFLGDNMKVVDERMVSIQHGSSAVLIRMLDSDEPRLQVFSMMLQGVKESPELLDVLNGLTAGLAFAKVFWADGDIIVAVELLAESLDRESLVNAVSVVATTADRFDDELKAKFGGETAYPQPEGEPSEQGASSEPATPSESRAEGAPEGIGLPPGMEQGEPAAATESGTDADAAPPEEQPAAAKPRKDPDESPGYL